MMTSTRRFCWRPAGVSLVATGFDSPKPRGAIAALHAAASPPASAARSARAARRASGCTSSEATESVWPSTRIGRSAVGLHHLRHLGQRALGVGADAVGVEVEQHRAGQADGDLGLRRLRLQLREALVQAWSSPRRGRCCAPTRPVVVSAVQRGHRGSRDASSCRRSRPRRRSAPRWPAPPAARGRPTARRRRRRGRGDGDAARRPLPPGRRPRWRRGLRRGAVERAAAPPREGGGGHEMTRAHAHLSVMATPSNGSLLVKKTLIAFTAAGGAGNFAQ